jgi:hypothetical protein
MGGQLVVFGQDANQVYHTFRHTDWLGLDWDEVMEAICADLESHLPLSVPPSRNAPRIGCVTVNGVRLEYHAHPISEGLVNVGSIVKPKTRPGA